LFPFVVVLGLPLVVAPVLLLGRGRRGRAARIQMMLTPPLVPVGAPCELNLHLTNTGDAALPPVSLDQPSEHWRSVAMTHRPVRETPRGPSPLATDAGRLVRWDRVGAHGSASSVLTLPTARRGVFTIGPLRLWVHDPFGLLGLIVATAAPVTLVVHPPAAATAIDSSARRGSGGPAPAGDRPPSAHSDDPAGEWSGLRPYQPGDRLHLLSWQAEARHGALLVHDFRPESGDLVSVALDDRAGVHRRRAFEEALSVLYRLVLDAAPRAPHFEVVTLSGRRVSGASTPEGMVELQTFLAGSLPRRDKAGPDPWRFAPPGTSVVVTTRTALPTLPHLPGDPSVVIVE
jgi:uncharacterized protein (DUF58 family)